MSAPVVTTSHSDDMYTYTKTEYELKNLPSIVNNFPRHIQQVARNFFFQAAQEFLSKGAATEVEFDHFETGGASPRVYLVAYIPEAVSLFSFTSLLETLGENLRTGRLTDLIYQPQETLLGKARQSLQCRDILSVVIHKDHGLKPAVPLYTIDYKSPLPDNYQQFLEAAEGEERDAIAYALHAITDYLNRCYTGAEVEFDKCQKHQYVIRVLAWPAPVNARLVQQIQHGNTVFSTQPLSVVVVRPHPPNNTRHELHVYVHKIGMTEVSVKQYFPAANAHVHESEDEDDEAHDGEGNMLDRVTSELRGNGHTLTHIKRSGGLKRLRYTPRAVSVNGPSPEEKLKNVTYSISKKHKPQDELFA